MLLLGGVFNSASVIAQNSEASWKDFTYVRQSQAWLSSYNAAGLKYLPVDNISIAEIYFNKNNGKYINYYESDNSYKFGAQVESFYRFSPSIVFYGKISYDNFKGKNMGGSAFINPYYNSFDIVEYADSTRGKKNMETYNIVGAISADLYKGLTLGGKIDYTTANYAKVKDLRHINKLLDMHFTVGLSYKINSLLEIGANYYYRRSVEGIEFDTYGNTDRKYESLISYGSFYGKSEMVSDNGFVKKGEERPMFNEFNGASFQLNLSLNSQISLFNEITYKSRSGYYGKRASSSVVYSEHDSNIMEYSGVLSYTEGNNQHSLIVKADKEKLENYETVYKSETKPENNTTVIVYYDPLKVAEKDLLNVKVEYTGNLGVEDYNPLWILAGGVAYHERKQTISLYPYYRKQTIKQTAFNLSAQRNFIKGRDMYSVSVGTSYRSGSGTAKKDGFYATPSESQTPPQNIDRYLYREYEYLTSKAVKANIGFRYSRLFDDLGIKGYASINYSLTKASDIEYLNGNNFNEINLVIGCAF